LKSLLIMLMMSLFVFFFHIGRWALRHATVNKPLYSGVPWILCQSFSCVDMSLCLSIANPWDIAGLNGKVDLDQS
jgi:hypothetical protein